MMTFSSARSRTSTVTAAVDWSLPTSRAERLRTLAFRALSAVAMSMMRPERSLARMRSVVI